MFSIPSAMHGMCRVGPIPRAGQRFRLVTVRSDGEGREFAGMCLSLADFGTETGSISRRMLSRAAKCDTHARQASGMLQSATRKSAARRPGARGSSIAAVMASAQAMALMAAISSPLPVEHGEIGARCALQSVAAATYQRRRSVIAFRSLRHWHRRRSWRRGPRPCQAAPDCARCCGQHRLPISSRFRGSTFRRMARAVVRPFTSTLAPPMTTTRGIRNPWARRLRECGGLQSHREHRGWRRPWPVLDILPAPACRPHWRAARLPACRPPAIADCSANRR